jgi:hypothetical protein
MLFARDLAVLDFDRRAQSCHHIKKIRKTGSDRAGILDRDEVPGGKPRDEEAHGDAMIEMSPAAATASTDLRRRFSLPRRYSLAL